MFLHNNYVDIHTHHVPTESNIAVINVFPDEYIPEPLSSYLYYSTGIHPGFINPQAKYLQSIIDRIAFPRFIAIGECGLDVFASTPMEIQEKLFREQIAISEAYNKPVIIHCVRAYNELIRINKDMKPIQPWILHGFSGNNEIARQCLRYHMYFSFNLKNLNHSSKIQGLTIPVSSVLLETDDSGGSIDEIFTRFGLLKYLVLDDLKRIIYENFMRVFPLVHISRE